MSDPKLQQSASTSTSTSTSAQPKVNLKIEALGGLAAGILGTVIGYPLDLVKTRMQTSYIQQQGAVQGAVQTQTQIVNKNLFQVGNSILRKEGVYALYKGMTPPLISLSILNTMTFTSYNYIRVKYNAKRGFDIRNAFAGMTTAPMASIISSVEHLVKTQMQLDNVNERRFRNSFHCVTTLVKEYGTLRVLYLGHGVNTVREAVFIGTYFYTYEGMRIKLDQLFSRSSRSSIGGYDSGDGTDYKAPAWTIPFAGGISGAWAWFVSFPLDCVKAGIQGQTLSTVAENGERIKNDKLQKMNAVFRDLIKTKGWRGLYAGVSPSIMRAFIVSSSRFSAYELVVKLCSDVSS